MRTWMRQYPFCGAVNVCTQIPYCEFDVVALQNSRASSVTGCGPL